jgi:hypothetical protein
MLARDVPYHAPRVKLTPERSALQNLRNKSGQFDDQLIKSLFIIIAFNHDSPEATATQDWSRQAQMQIKVGPSRS